MRRLLAHLAVFVCALASLALAAPADAQLPAPTLTATSISRSEIDLSWTSVINAVSYNVYRSGTSGGEGTTPYASTTATSYHNTGLGSSSPFFYQVAAVASGGTVGTFSTEQEAVTAPTGVHTTAGDASVALTWNLSGTSGVTYNVYRASGGSYTKITSSPVTTAAYIDTSAVNETAYTYEITATSTGATQVPSVPSSPTAAVTPALQINAGGPALTSSGATAMSGDLVSWGADNGLPSPGSMLVKMNTITNLPSGVPYQVFQSQRQSDGSYTLPMGGKGFLFNETGLPNGNYTLTLYFAETGNSVNGAGQRTFNIFVNGAQVATAFDIYAAAGGKNIAVAESYPVTVTGGQFSLAYQDTNSTYKSLAAAFALGPPASFAADVPAPDYAADVIPTDDAGTGGGGPSDGISADLASGVEENHPGPDLSVYNPVGPAAMYERMYRSSRALSGTTGYGSPALSPGWMDNYDYQVTKNANSYTLTYPNGNTETWSGTTGSLTVPTGAPYLANAPNTSTLTMTFKDRSVYTFTLDTGSTTLYRLTSIVNIAQHALTIARDSSHRLLTVKNDASPVATLLSFTYPTGTTMKVTDAYGRFVNLTFGTLGTNAILTSVSQIASSGSPAALWNYGYAAISAANNLPFLNTVQTPSPANPGSYSAASIMPNSNGTVNQITDGRTGSAQGFHVLTPGGGKTVVTTGQNPSAPVTNLTAAALYGTFNKQTGAVDAENNASSALYTDLNNPYQPTQVTNRNGEITTFAYDQQAGSGIPYSGNLSTMTDAWGVTTTMTYYPSDFALGELQKVQQSSTNGGATTHAATTYAYYSSGYLDDFLETVTTPNPNVQNGGGTSPTIDTEYTYDTTPTVKGLGNVTDVKTPGANSTLGMLSTYTDTSYTYASTPALGEPITVTVTGPNAAAQGGQSSQSVTYTYNTSGVNTGTVSSMTDAMGYQTSYAYNVANQMTTMTYPASMTGGGRASVVYAYQYVGGPLASTTLYDESGSQFEQVTYTYDAEGNLVQKRGNTYPVDYAYDGIDRVTAMTEYSSLSGNAKEITSYGYDPVGRLSDTYYPGWTGAGTADHWNYTYDKDDNLTVRTDGNGSTTTYARDPTLSALVDSITYTAGTTQVQNTGVVAFSYDGYERRSLMTDESNSPGSKSYTYSDVNLPLTVTTSFTGGPQNQQIAYNYNYDGSRSAMTPPLAPMAPGTPSFTYAYDGLGRTSSVTAPFYDDLFSSSPNKRTTPHAVTYGYQANSWLTSMSQGTLGVLETTGYAYNGRGFLTSLTNQNNGSTVSAFDTTGAGGVQGYDAAGNRLGFSETLNGVMSGMSGTTRTVGYGYDVLNQLTGETSSIGSTYGSILNANYTYGYGYDDVGNPTTWKSTMGDFGFNADNQVTSVMSLTSPVYDGSGNPTVFSTYATTQAGAIDNTNVNLSGASLAFDSENRLVGLSSSSPSIAFSALYDGDGMRSEKTVGSTTTYYLYDGDQLLEEMTFPGSTPTLQEMYLTGADGVRARWDAPNYETDVYDYDPQGSLSEFQVTESANPDQRTLVYDGWGYLAGNILYVHGTEQAPISGVGFGGQSGYYQDIETGLYQLGARYYDAGKGRFVTRDPIGYGGGANLYGFCGNNPINESDPDGTRAEGPADLARFAKLRAIAKSAGPKGSNTATAKAGDLVDGCILELEDQIKASKGTDDTTDPARLRAAWWAIDQLGSSSYSYGAAAPTSSYFYWRWTPNGAHLFNSNKCNIFVADAYCSVIGGDNVPEFGDPIDQHPASANSLASPGFNEQHFNPLAHTGLTGDVIAFFEAGPGGVGHSGIYLGNGLLIYASTFGVKVGDIAYNMIGHDSYLYRRYSAR